jgi:predicted secreted protein
MLTGAINGTDVYLRVYDSVGLEWLDIGGQVSHTSTLASGAIDITNKFSGKVRELMDVNGIQSIDVTAEFIFNSEASFKFMLNAANTQSTEVFQIWRGAGVIRVDELSMKIVSVQETANDGAALTASVQFQSSSAISIDHLSVEGFNVTEGQFMTQTDGDPESFVVQK